jgi:EAL domain-containing protein (putative c-di-GMP-specific phosphodiesterase class I)
VQSVITLSRGLGIDVVAEGVETENEAAIMTHFGCTELQGYYFSKPMEADEMADFVIHFQPRPIVTQMLDPTG